MNKTITVSTPSFRWVRTTIGAQIKAPTTETHEWIEDDYKCPYCGVTPVYVQSGDGDYYVGPTYICAACAGTFTIQGGAVDADMAALIRAAIEVPNE